MNLPEAAEALVELLTPAAETFGWHLREHEWVDELHAPSITVGIPTFVDSHVTVGRPQWDFVVTLAVDPRSTTGAVASFLLAIDAHDDRSIVNQIKVAAERSDAMWQLGPITTGTEDRGQVELLLARIPVSIIPAEVSA